MGRSGLPQPTVEGKDDHPAEQGLTINGDARQNSGKKKGRTARNRKRRKQERRRPQCSTKDKSKTKIKGKNQRKEKAEKIASQTNEASEKKRLF